MKLVVTFLTKLANLCNVTFRSVADSNLKQALALFGG